MRGRAFVSVTFICMAWIIVRLVMHDAGPNETKAPLNRKDDMQHRSDLAVAAMRPKRGGYPVQTARPRAHSLAKPLERSLKHPSRARTATRANNVWESPTQEQITIKAVTSAAAVPELTGMPLAMPRDPPSGKRPKAFEIYAYSFWRRGGDPDGQLGSGLYGGSQSALAITVPLRRFHQANGAARLAFIGRYSTATGDRPDRELAAGVQWRPLARLPAVISLERRFRFGRADAVAAFVAGGHDGARLPGGFVVDGYGQAGIVSGDGGGPFAEVQMHAQQLLVSNAQGALRLGAGVWGGGQDKHMRLDVGPAIRAQFPVGGTQMRVDASWRFRIAGTARPDSGPAVTLSTSF